MPRKDLHEQNRVAWNAATDAHNSHKADQAGFFRAGGSTLYPEEIEIMGDVRGKTLLHLQCNAGQDTLSWAARGAVVTGVDISDTAVDFARQLSADTGIQAVFQRADVFDYLEQTEERFDLAFSSYGALVWLSDLATWGRGIARVLKPGGLFGVIDFHPALTMFDSDMKLLYPYFGGEVTSFDNGVGDYVAMAGPLLAPSGYLEGVQNFTNPHPDHEFSWSVGEVVMALVNAGLTLTLLREYPYTNGFNPLIGMRALPGRRFASPEGIPDLPMMFAVTARKLS